jgi:chromosome partitioning protein
MVNLRRKIEKQRLSELSQSFDIAPPIRNLVQMQESISLGRPVFAMGNKTKGAQDYSQLWQSLDL